MAVLGLEDALRGLAKKVTGKEPDKDAGVEDMIVFLTQNWPEAGEPEESV